MNPVSSRISGKLDEIKKIYLIEFFYNLHFFSAVLVPFFTVWGKITLTQVMILQSIFQMTILLLEVPTGMIADRIGRKKSIALALLLFTIGILVYGSTPNFYVFALGEFIIGVGAAFSSGSMHAFVYDTLRASGKSSISKKVFSNIQAMDMLGLTISAPLGSIMAHYMGLRAPLILTAVPLFVAFLLSLTLKEPQRIHGMGERKPSYAFLLRQSTQIFRKVKELRILALDLIVVGSLAYFLIWTYQPKLMSVNFPIAYFGFVATMMTGFQFLISRNMLTVESMLGGKKNFVFLSALIPGICFVMMSMTQNWIVIIVSLLVATLGLARRAVMVSYINKYIKSTSRATVLSFVNMTNSLILAIINPLVGKLMDISIDISLAVIGILLIMFSFLSRVEERMLPD